MAKIDVETVVSAPKKIQVNLVREDHLNTSNIFRILFEVTLSGSSVLLGNILATDTPTLLHYVFLVTLVIAAIVFIVLTIKFSKSSSSDFVND